MNGSLPSEMRIVRKFPLDNWARVWQNLYASPVPDAIMSTWYKALHDLIPTNNRLAAINLTDTSARSSCGQIVSLQNRIAECEEGPLIWTWTKKLVGFILRVDHRHIPQDWTIRTSFQHWPAQKQAAVFWILAQLVHYRLQTHRRLSLSDYTDFLRRAKWKLYHQARRPRVTGKYVDVFD